MLFADPLCFQWFHIDYVGLLHFPSIVFLLIPALFVFTFRAFLARASTAVFVTVCLFVSACLKIERERHVSEVIVKHFRLT